MLIQDIPVVHLLRDGTFSLVSTQKSIANYIRLQPVRKSQNLNI